MKITVIAMLLQAAHDRIIAMTTPPEFQTKPEMWRQLAAKIGHDTSEQIKALGTGTMGTAYLLSNGNVLKVTPDQIEAVAMNKIVGKRLDHVVQVHHVFDIGDGKFAVVMEKCEKAQQDWLDFFAITEQFFLNALRAVTPDSVKQFEAEWKQATTNAMVTADGFDDWGDINPGDDIELKNQPVEWPSEAPDPAKLSWLKGLARELTGVGIEFSDMNPGNIMRRIGGNHVVIDLGVSKTTGGSPIPKIE